MTARTIHSHRRAVVRRFRRRLELLPQAAGGPMLPAVEAVRLVGAPAVHVVQSQVHRRGSPFAYVAEAQFAVSGNHQRVLP